jgi:hypothetical protein
MVASWSFDSLPATRTQHGDEELGVADTGGETRRLKHLAACSFIITDQNLKE